MTEPTMGSTHTLPAAGEARGVVLVWMGLVALTLASWWFRDHGLGPQAAIVTILVISFVKVFLVGHSFMEIHRGPPVLRLVFTAWCALTCATLVILALTL